MLSWFLISVLFLSAGSLNGAADSSKTIFINEILASNLTTNPDNAFGEFGDWIELYNSSDTDADISGYYLSDDETFPAKWKIPTNAIIPAKGFSLFWADGYDSFNHTNFKLGVDGEFIGLFNTEEVLVDGFYFPKQETDISYVRFPNGDSLFYYSSMPTPAKENISRNVRALAFSNNPKSSYNSGRYDSQILLELSSDSWGEVRFTLDGSVPNFNSPIYTEPVILTKTAVVRFRSYESGKLPSETISKTFLISEDISLPVVSIITDSSNLWDDETGIYTVGTNGIYLWGITANYWRDWERPVQIEYFENNKISFRLSAGVAINGARRNMLPKSFRVFARNKYGDNSIDYSFFTDRNYNSQSSFILRNGGYPEFRHSIFKDGMLQSLLIDRMDIDYMAYQPSVLFVNGEYWGIYNIREKQNEEYLQSLHGVNPDSINIIELEGRPVAIEGSIDEYNSMMAFVENNPLTVEENYNYIKSIIDLDEYINYNCAQIYFANIDWPSNNVKLWKPMTPSGKWRWMLYDVEAGFGLAADHTHNTLNHALEEEGPSFPNPPWSTLLFRRLMENTEFREKFIGVFSTHLNTSFDPARVVDFIERFKLQIAPEIPRHIERWSVGCNPNTKATADGCTFPSVEEWEWHIQQQITFANNRPVSIFNHLKDRFSLNDLVKVSLNFPLKGALKIFINNVEIVDNNFDGSFFPGIPIKLQAELLPGYTFEGWQTPEGILPNNSYYTPTTNSEINALLKKIDSKVIPNLINEQFTLTAANSPYYIVENIFILTEGILIAESGVEILVNDSLNIYVFGKLDVRGEHDNPVRFRSSSLGRWGAICADGGSLKISNAFITGATEGFDAEKFPAAVSGFNSIIELDSVRIYESNAPVFLRFGSAKITNSFIHTTVISDGINIKFADAITENCEIRGGSSEDTDGIDYDGVINGIIRNNKIYNFLGDNSDGIDLGEGSKNILVENNIISNCFDKGISIGQASTANIKNNIIANCGLGVGVKDYNSIGEIDRTVFYKNTIGVYCYEKILQNGGGRANITNSIFSLSNEASVKWDDQSIVNISFSLSDTDVLEGEGNLFADPLFTDPDNFDFSLQSISPCINSGNPVDEYDPDGSPADMGLILNPKIGGEEIYSIVINEINYNSHSDYDSEDWIELINTKNYNIDLSAWSLVDEAENKFDFPQNSSINANEYLVLCRDKSKFRLVYPEAKPFSSAFNFGLSSSGELLRLYNNFGEMVDSVRFSVTEPWPVSPNGSGNTLELKNPSLNNNLANNWGESFSIGTPGKQNSNYELISLVNERTEITDFALSQNYPNPFNPETVIKFQIPGSAFVSIKIFDLLGREIQTLVSEELSPGSYSATFNAASVANGLSSGVYFYRMTVRSKTNAFVQTKKLMLLK